ncbi:sucrose-phosphate synthase [Ranunculus cassubicifolius]
MCWRTWNLARTKKQMEGDLAQSKAKQRVERERGRREAIADMSEDLSEGEKGDMVGDMSTHGDSTRGRMKRVSSVDVMDSLASMFKGRKLYIVLIRCLMKFLTQYFLQTSFLTLCNIYCQKLHFH